MFEMMVNGSGLVSSALSLVSIIVAAVELIARLRARLARRQQQHVSTVLSRTERRALARAARSARRITVASGKRSSHCTARAADCRT